MVNLGVIAARGGSKRFPGKNLKKLAGLPLIVYSIKAAQTSHLLDDFLVSTDDETIAAVSRESGAPVAVLTQTAANRLFPDGNAIGRQVVSGMEGSDHLITVVGIVGDVKTLGLDQGGPLII